MQYELMKPHEVDAVVKDKPIAYLPWGAVEWHAGHNPLGLDGLKAHHLCLEACRVTGGVVLPPVYCGYVTLKPWRRFGRTMEFSKSLVRQYALEYLENLYDDGFRVMVIIMGHFGPKHVEAIRDAAAEFRERHLYPRVLAVPDWEPASWVDVKAGDHAGLHETSLMMYFRPDLVDLSLLPERDLDYRTDGCHVNAKESTTAHGAELAKVFVEQVSPKVAELLEEANTAWPPGR